MKSSPPAFLFVSIAMENVMMMEQTRRTSLYLKLL
jgi:hypothetical protein